MSKRKNRKNQRPNLPKATLERARQQLNEGVEEEQEEVVEAAPSRRSAARAESAPAPSPRAAGGRKGRLTPQQIERAKQRDELDAETIAYTLAHPYKEVSDEELATEYRHVLLDLRNMGILAAVLIVMLVVLAQFI